MRPIGLLLCLAACTLDNPAFLTATATEGASTGATDPTRPTSGASETTAASGDTQVTTTATGPDVTGDVATTMSVSDSATTDTPVTSGETSTTGSMTATGDPNETETGEMMCAAFGDAPGPLVPLISLPDLQPIATATCVGWQGLVFGGRLDADNTGFSVVSDVECLPNNLPVEGLRFPVHLASLPVAKGLCVTVRFAVHPGYSKCTIAAVDVVREQKPALWGSFGMAPFPPNLPIAVQPEPTGTCDCAGCCGPGPDPDLYKFTVGNSAVGEGDSAMFELNGVTHQFTNLRSHVHAGDCMNEMLQGPDWLHFDWVVVQPVP